MKHLVFLFFFSMNFFLGFSQNEISCIQTDALGNITVNWTQSNDPTNSFISYQLNSVEDGFYNAITNINSTSSVVSPLGLINNFYIQSNFSLSNNQYSDTLSNIFLILNNPSNGVAGLIWNKPSTKDLGGYYKIYREYPSGTWTLRDSVPFQTTYYNDTIDVCNAFFNYQIRYDYNGCTFTSNIEGDNFQDIITPDIPIISSISYDTTNNYPVVSWNINSKPDTYGYIVYVRDQNGFIIELDTIFGRTNTSYTYPFTPKEGVAFSVAAFDSCFLNIGNQIFQTSAKAQIQESINLEGTLNVCEHEIQLNWNEYDNWDSKQYYVIHFKKGNQNWEILDTVNYRQYNFTGTPFETYHFTIETINSDGRFAFSNVYTQKINSPSVPSFNYIEVATVTSTNTIELKHQIELTSGVSALSIQRLNHKGNFEELGIIENPSSQNSFEDQNIETGRNTYIYRIVVIDSCGNYGDTSNIAQTILLNGNINQTSKEVYLEWNPYQEFNGPILKYEVYRSMNNIFEINPISSLNKKQFSFRDHIDTIDIDGEVCYYIRAIETYNQFNNAEISYSNIKCFTLNPIVFIPNSFTPNGDRVNETFKPIISLANLNNYNLLIFNRWEHPIFESNNYDIGWDGSIMGSSQKAAVGSYLYQVSFTDGSGVYKVKRGVVTLMR